MITINMERCTGCGACLEVCPEGALYLVDDRVVLDSHLCRECEICIAVCPREAILRAEPIASSATEPAQTPALRPEPEIVRINTHPRVPLQAKMLPAVGAALVWAGREIVPRLAEYLVYDLDRRVAERRRTPVSRTKSADDASISGRGGGRRHRHRRGR